MVHVILRALALLVEIPGVYSRSPNKGAGFRAWGLGFRV